MRWVHLASALLWSTCALIGLWWALACVYDAAPAGAHTRRCDRSTSRTRVRRTTGKLAERFCTTTEIEALRGIPESARRARMDPHLDAEGKLPEGAGAGTSRAAPGVLVRSPFERTGSHCVRPGSEGRSRALTVRGAPTAVSSPSHRCRRRPIRGPWSLVLVEESFDSFRCALRSTGIEVTEPGR